MRLLKLGCTSVGRTKFRITHKGGFVNITIATGRNRDGDFWLFTVRVSTDNAKKRGIIAQIESQISKAKAGRCYVNTLADRVRLKDLLVRHVDDITWQRA